MGSEQFATLMNGFNSLSNYVRLLSFRVDSLGNEVKFSKEEMNARFMSLNVQLESFKGEVNARFDKVDTRLTQIDTHLTNIGSNIEKISDWVPFKTPPVPGLVKV